MGLKPGIYSTPWITSYAKFTGGSSDDPSGAWSEKQANDKCWRHGKYSFAANDARQWAAWGFDYLKYDWNPNDVPHVEEMSKALRQSGRDIVYSLSNSAPFAHAADWARLANCWRTTGDIWDYWDHSDDEWRYSVSEIGFHAGPLGAVCRPGPLERPGHAGGGLRGMGPATARHEADAGRAILAHQHVVPALRAASDRLRHGTARSVHAQPAHQRRGAGARPGRAGQAGEARGGGWVAWTCS